MTRRTLERMLWISAVWVAAIGAQHYASGRIGDDYRLIASVRMALPPAVRMFARDTLRGAAARTTEHDPFRLERRPASVAFSTTPLGPVLPQAPVGPTIHIALQGTIGGPPWQAILSGIPGHDGTTVVRSGDTLGGIAIRRVSRDSVVVRVKDSTWTVTLARSGM